jgi:hypothetical protein
MKEREIERKNYLLGRVGGLFVLLLCDSGSSSRGRRDLLCDGHLTVAVALLFSVCYWMLGVSNFFFFLSFSMDCCWSLCASSLLLLYFLGILV